ncbi:hypothetical protein FVP74_03150 [Microbacterium saccharophilum]|uniref:O-antigen ligase family protein n=1 Tax=Microbacterium saccharophilum TaxID=1213358 RepID=A0A5C8I9C7_9MICO|nr:hypothetical protein [Microbacterium saccharophilum]TXK15408.1 hypothetical protein FVP74_03150 [Microbacterium saccharophilum]
MGLLVSLSTAVVVIPGLSFTLLGVVAVVLLPVTAIHLREPAGKWFVRGILVWLTSVLVSVILQNTSVMSGGANVTYPLVTLATYLLLLHLARESPRRLKELCVWVAVGLAAGAIWQPIISTSLSPIKLGAGLGLAVAAVALASNARRGALGPAIIVATGVVLLLLDFRSLGLIVILSVLPNLFGRVDGRSLRPTHGVALLIAAMGVVWAISGALQAGWFGSDAKARFDSQMGSSAGLIEVARPEIVVSMIALRDSWFTGRGFGASLDNQEASLAVGTYIQMGLPLNDVQLERILGGGINSHSLLFTIWIATGLLGAMGVALIVAHCWRAVGPSAAYGIVNLTLFAALLVTWDALFSPWNVRGEVWLGLAGAIATLSIRAKVYSTVLDRVR